jgi:uncharacterized OB-fold protein
MLNSHGLVCIFFGHRDETVALHLGKISIEKVNANRCSRCGRISIPKSELAQASK